MLANYIINTISLAAHHQTITSALHTQEPYTTLKIIEAWQDVDFLRLKIMFALL